MPRVYKISCTCMKCEKCKNRVKMRNYWDRRRANGGEPLWKPWAPPPRRPPLTPEHGWLAGIIDGEGCIGVRRPEYRTPSVEVIVGMTHEESVRRCREITGIGRVHVRSMKHRKKPLWVWSIYASNARDVLWLVLPLLVTKRELAESIVEGGDAK